MPGPSISQRPTVSPGSIRRLGAPLRPIPRALAALPPWPGAPVGFSKEIERDRKPVWSRYGSRTGSGIDAPRSVGAAGCAPAVLSCGVALAIDRLSSGFSAFRPAKPAPAIVAISIAEFLRKVRLLMAFSSSMNSRPCAGLFRGLSLELLRPNRIPIWMNRGAQLRHFYRVTSRIVPVTACSRQTYPFFEGMRTLM